MIETEFTAYIKDLKELSEALALAVSSDFMAREHAKAIWMSLIKQSPINIDKKIPEKDK